MQHSSRRGGGTTNLAFFYIEQWVALLLGTALLGISMWATFHIPPSSPVRDDPWLVKALVLLDFHRLFLLAADLMGLFLLRFAFHAHFKEPVDDVPISTPIKAPRQAAIKVSNRNVKGRD